MSYIDPATFTNKTTQRYRTAAKAKREREQQLKRMDELHAVRYSSRQIARVFTEEYVANLCARAAENLKKLTEPAHEVATEGHHVTPNRF